MVWTDLNTLQEEYAFLTNLEETIKLYVEFTMGIFKILFLSFSSVQENLYNNLKHPSSL